MFNVCKNKKIQLQEALQQLILNDNFYNYLENIAIIITSNGLTQKWMPPRINWYVFPSNFTSKVAGYYSSSPR